MRFFIFLVCRKLNISPFLFHIAVAAIIYVALQDDGMMYNPDGSLIGPGLIIYLAVWVFVILVSRLIIGAAYFKRPSDPDGIGRS